MTELRKCRRCRGTGSVRYRPPLYSRLLDLSERGPSWVWPGLNGILLGGTVSAMWYVTWLGTILLVATVAMFSIRPAGVELRRRFRMMDGARWSAYTRDSAIYITINSKSQSDSRRGFLPDGTMLHLPEHEAKAAADWEDRQRLAGNQGDAADD